MHLIQVSGPASHLSGQYLQGPRNPQQVARYGYGFTPDPVAAWPFVSAAQALAKARIVNRHMGWTPCLTVTGVPPVATTKTLGLRLTR